MKVFNSDSVCQTKVASRVYNLIPLHGLVGGEMSVVQSLLAELPSQFLAYVRAHPTV